MRRLGIVVAMPLLLSSFTAARTGEIARWTRFQTQFTSSKEYANPVQDVQLDVEFISPTGKKQIVPAFWDGGKTWKVRFSPEETGTWSFRTSCSNQGDGGLHNQTGKFACVPYSGKNHLYEHGAIRLSANRRHLVHADGTPFFWLSDTSWGGVLKSNADEWERYLQDRVSKGFTVVQFATTQFIASRGDREGRTAFSGRERIAINPEFYRRMDERLNTLNGHGLVAAPVLIWAAAWGEEGPTLNPGLFLPDDQIIVLGRYIVARYSAHQVIWILAGDGDYLGEKAERWRKIGRAIFKDVPARLASTHPAGQHWVGEEFRNEPWFSFIGYQSGHGDSPEALRWLCEGPPSTEWRKAPQLPVINLEPNYEDHTSYQSRMRFDNRAVRRAAYWSLLVSPTAGITYGGHGVWAWDLQAEEPLNHPGTGVARPWFEAINLPGSTGMKHLTALFSSLEWWRLLPDPDLVAEQPGKTSPGHFIAASRTEEGDVAVIYIPEGGRVILQMDRMKSPVAAEWFDPANGKCWPAGKIVNQGHHEFNSGGEGDRVLILRGER